MPASILDDCLPEFDFGHRHAVPVAAPPACVQQAAEAYRLDESRTIRVLFRLRGLPAPGTFPKSLRAIGFQTLGEEDGREIVFGLAVRVFGEGRVFDPIPADSPSAFRALATGRTIKIAANLRFDPLPGGQTRLSTETRIRCTGGVARAVFAPYWILVRTGSSIIRRIMLAGIGAEALRRTPTPG